MSMQLAFVFPPGLRFRVQCTHWKRDRRDGERYQWHHGPTDERSARRLAEIVKRALPRVVVAVVPEHGAPGASKKTTTRPRTAAKRRSSKHG